MTQSNGQRSSNPHRFAIWRSRPFPDGTPPKAEFSINCFIPLDVIRDLYNAIASGTIQPEQDRHGVPGVTLWGNGFRGTGAPTQGGGTSPVMSGSFNTHKALWQAQQAAGHATAQPPVQQACAAAFPPPQQAAPAPAAGPAPWQAPELPRQQQPAAPQAQPQAAPAPANQWASQPPAGF